MRKPYKGNILLGSQVPGLKQSLRYIDGDEPPNYPVPATVDNAEIAGSYLYLSLCPWNKTDGPCPVCIEKYLDSIEDWFTDN